ncbi:hypothetical protein FHW58_000094 [Duganella sp. 1224]|uniref:hypothetical protein n=1 Tax=Duganella sp. 1224 TaxID=2587052 RepID=UPI0015CBDDD1|nr:hypothetical protein [Duganella sp. 1224]NYE58942.1 hypothetical protein [Duganella sp. 1224]
MNKADTADRAPDKIDWTVVNANDAQRRQRVSEMLARGEIRTAEDYYHAAMIYQHGEKPKDFQLAHAFAVIASRLEPGQPAPKWLIAASWDRYLMWKKLPQWYGTQYQVSKDGVRSLYPVDPNAVTDADRAALHVPSLAEAMADAQPKPAN